MSLKSRLEHKGYYELGMVLPSINIRIYLIIQVFMLLRTLQTQQGGASHHSQEQ